MNTDELYGLPEPTAPPRRNGELAFDEPWESAVFGVTLGLCEHGNIRFEDFQRRLVEEITAWERGPRDREWSYWTHWLIALERELAARNLLGSSEIDARVSQVLHSYTHAEPHGTHEH